MYHAYYDEHLHLKYVNAPRNTRMAGGTSVFHKDTIYVIGDSKTASNNPIMQQFNSYFIGLVIDRNSHRILEAECSSTISLTSKFVQSIFNGRSMMEVEEIISDIESRYFGASQKALIVAFKNAHIKYNQIING